MVYGDNREVMIEFIHASAQRMYSLTQNKQLSDTMFHAIQNPTVVSLQQYRALFFLLLNVDMQMKEYVCDTVDANLLAIALNIPPVEIRSKQSYVMTGARKPSALKLESFFHKLSREIVPNWLQNQGAILDDLINTIREEYIIA
jgi:hypothetical protein